MARFRRNGLLKPAEEGVKLDVTAREFHAVQSRGDGVVGGLERNGASGGIRE